MSRPEIQIDWDKADELIKAGCPGTEVAAYFGIHPETLYRRVQDKFNVGFTEYLQEKKSSGEALLRAHQFDKALGKTKKGDTQLLLMLGRERLGQKEQKENQDHKEYLELLKKISDKIQSNTSTVVSE